MKEHKEQIIRLNPQRRLRIVEFAATKFRDDKLRGAERAARQAIADMWPKFHAKHVAPSLQALCRFGLARHVTQISFPWDMQYATDKPAEFEVDGKIVLRKRGRNLCVPCDLDHIVTFYNWQSALKFGHSKLGVDREANITGMKVSTIAIDKCLVPDGYRNGNSGEICLPTDTALYDTRHNDARDADPASYWIQGELYDAVAAYYLAFEARQHTEHRLLTSVVKLVASVDTVRDVEQFFPEVAQIKAELAPSDAAAPIFALVAISNEDKAALCENMKARGVTNAVMCVA